MLVSNSNTYALSVLLYSFSRCTDGLVSTYSKYLSPCWHQSTHPAPSAIKQATCKMAAWAGDKCVMVNPGKVTDPSGDQNYYFVLFQVVKTEAASRNVNSQWIREGEGRESATNTQSGWQNAKWCQHITSHRWSSGLQRSANTWVSTDYQRGIRIWQ